MKTKGLAGALWCVSILLAGVSIFETLHTTAHFHSSTLLSALFIVSSALRFFLMHKKTAKRFCVLMTALLICGFTEIAISVKHLNLLLGLAAVYLSVIDLAVIDIVIEIMSKGGEKRE